MDHYTERITLVGAHCDRYRRMRPDALFLLMQEGGGRHAESLGLGYEEMCERGCFFALSRGHIEITRPGMFGETLVHTTWCGKPNHFFIPRYHRFTLEDGTPVAAAACLWVLMSPKDRKIVSPLTIASFFPDTSGDPAPVELPKRVPVHPKEAESSLYTPVYTDYDVNGHVNNTKYIGWLTDRLGLSVMENSWPSSLIVSFEKEIRSEDPIVLSLHREGASFSFLASGQDGTRYFQAGGTLASES